MPKLFDHDRGYIFQNADGRIVFAIPYEQEFTLIGTTDVDFAGDLGRVSISAEEIAYLCGAASEYFTRPVDPLRHGLVLCGGPAAAGRRRVSAQEATRDFVLDLDGREGAAPLLNVFGGKITTFRHLAEEAMKKLAAAFPGMGAPWTRGLDAARRRFRRTTSATGSSAICGAGLPFSMPHRPTASSRATGPSPSRFCQAPRS